MVTQLESNIYTEKYRPSQFAELITENKDLLLSYLKEPATIPSFIFYSAHPGTGKTSSAKVIIKSLGCDSLAINSSDERGIDTIREKIKLFAMSLSTNPLIKRCIFLDEADGLTKQAQDSLRNLMESYSDNCFFIFSCNDVSKIIEPIRSRCVLFCFEKPNKADVMDRLTYITEQEKIEFSYEDLIRLVDMYYPDIRSMVMTLQKSKLDNKSIASEYIEFESFLEAVLAGNVVALRDKTYSSDFNVMSFNKWFFDYIFNNYEKYDSTVLLNVALALADTEKSWNQGANIEVVFLTNMLLISKLLRK